MAEKVTYKSLFDPKLESQISDLQKQIDRLSKSIDSLAKEAKTIKANNQQTGKSYSDNAKKIEKLNLVQKTLIEKQKEQQRIEKQLVSVYAKRITQDSKRVKQLEKGRQELAKNKNELKQIVRAERAQKGSIEALQAATAKLITKRRMLGDIEGKNKAEYDKLTRSIAQNTVKLKAYDKQIGSSQRDVGNYGKALQGLRAGFSKFIGAAGVVTGIIAGFVGFNRALRDTSKIQNKLRFAFGTTGKELEKQTALIKSLSSFYEQDYNNVLKSANTFAKEFGISGTKSLLLIEQGFAKGADNSGEFLEILKEYPTQFKSVGLNAEQSIAIITQQVREGIYSDKGIDAIKEGGIRLRENTKAVQEALAPLSDAVKLQIAQKVEAGETFEAIQLISKELGNSALNASEVQTIIADVFGGAGEDAGLRYLETLKDINVELSKIPENLNDFELASLNLTKQFSQLITTVGSGEGVFGRVFGDIKSFLGDFINRVNILNRLGSAGEGQFIDILAESGRNASLAINLLNEDLQQIGREQVSQIRRTGQESEEVKLLRSQYEQTRDVLREYYTQYFEGKDITAEQLEIFRRYNIILPEVSANTDGLTQSNEEAETVTTRLTDAQIKQIRSLDQIALSTKEYTEFENELLNVYRDIAIPTIQDLVDETDKLLKAENDAGISTLQSKEETEELTKAREAANEELQKQQSALRVLGDIQKGLDIANTLKPVVTDYINLLDQRAQKELDVTNQALQNSESVIASKQAEIEKEREKNTVGSQDRTRALQGEIKAEQDKANALVEIQRQQFERTKKLQKAQVFINLATELSQIALYAAQNPLNGLTGGSSGVGVYIAQSGLAIGRSILALANINKQEFAEGTEYVNGAGTATSDSINAMLSKGERVVPTRINNALSGIPNNALPSLVGAGLEYLSMQELNGKMDTNNNLLKAISSNTGLKQSKNKTGQTITRRGNSKIIS